MFMKRALLLSIVGVVSLFSFASGIIGYWKGEVMSLPIVFHVEEKDGNLLTTLDSPM